MNRESAGVMVVSLASAVGIALGAFGMAAQAQTPPLRAVGAVVATSPPLGVFEAVIPLANGNVLVQDYRRRQVILFDSALSPIRTVLDSIPGRPDSFCSSGIGGPGTNICYLLPFGRDSALRLDVGAATFVVIGPDGALGRTFAPPPGFLAVSQQAGIPLSSRELGFIWLSRVRHVIRARRDLPPGIEDTVRMRDSLAVTRLHYDTRKVDTLAHLEMGTYELRIYRGVSPEFAASGSGQATMPYPYPARDQLAMTSDGGLVVLHSREYRLDWFGPDGTLLPGGRLAYPGERITDERRQSLMDSINARRLGVYDSLLSLRAEDSVRLGRAPTRPTPMTNGGVTTIREMPVPPPRKPILAIEDDIPNYLPVSNQILGDQRGRIWIRRIASPGPGLIQWDGVDRTMGLVSRIVVPSDRWVVGFGDGVVFMAVPDGSTLRLVKARIEY